MASAKIYEMHRIRSLRLQIHVGVFLIASVAWLIRSTSVNTSFGAFLLWLALFVIALKSLANALESSTLCGQPSSSDWMLVSDGSTSTP